MNPEQQYKWLKKSYYPDKLSNIKMCVIDSDVFWSWKYNNCWECHYSSLENFNIHNSQYSEIQESLIVKLFSEYYYEKLFKGQTVCYYPFYEQLNNKLFGVLGDIKFYKIVENYNMFNNENLSAILFSNTNYKNFIIESKHKFYGKQFLTEWRPFNGKF